MRHNVIVNAIGYTLGSDMNFTSMFPQNNIQYLTTYVNL